MILFNRIPYEVVETFGISPAKLKRRLRKNRECGDPAPRYSPGRKRRTLAAKKEKHALEAQLEENDEATLERHCRLWERKRGARVFVATMSRTIRYR